MEIGVSGAVGIPLGNVKMLMPLPCVSQASAISCMPMTGCIPCAVYYKIIPLDKTAVCL